MIEREYESGAGFSEVARSTVATDASRSVDAVADVLYTVVSGQSAAGNVSEAQLRRYIVNAYRFYIARGNKVEIEAAAGRLDGLVAATPAMREEVGDMFSAAGMKERAMVEYRAVVQEAPDRREVVDKMANYYVEQGQAALKEERFESALESFQEALNANPLHPEAEGLRLQAERSLSDREARLSASRGAIQRAEELFSLAEEEALRNRFAEAIDMLRQSMDAYGEVSEEFPAENQERVRGQDKVRERVRQYKQELITNARVFSGTAYAQDVRKFAETAAPDLEERALRALIENEYKAQISALENQLKAEPSR
ncbi:MAG: hypothetical protein HYZ00_10510 [Candidatus Hydrogenedentes bacterium]|nr:hypothetical protein [Candidatus Hydrogenedentota bacterium]